MPKLARFSWIVNISGFSLQSAVDGSYDNAFVGEKTWPFSIQIDLLKECNLSDIQISWYMCKGSEGYYTYYVEGSTDGINWTKLLDRTDESSDRVTNTYGFTNDALSGTARYVRLTVTNAHLHNNPNNNWYTPTIYEIRVLGKPVNNLNSQNKTENQPIAAYHLDKAEISNGKISDKTGKNGDLELYGDY
ncbi:MAG: discoidin domain-containing protein [Hominimerdicola sp.]